MSHIQPTRREMIAAAAGLAGLSLSEQADAADTAPTPGKEGAQRLTVEQLKRWQALGYGMFIHFGMSTFTGDELDKGKAPAGTYAPDQLDVDQWVSVARDSGMKYIVLTAKHVAGHCLWPTKYTDYSVANSTNKTNVIEAFVKSCEKRGVMPGFYYCSWDNHNRFASRTFSDKDTQWGHFWRQAKFKEIQETLATRPAGPAPGYTTSVYQEFQTLQLEELLTQFGPIGEVWIDIPGVLGRGYREYLYGKIAQWQPQTVVMMNNGFGDGSKYPVDYAWPADIMAMERCQAPTAGFDVWREIEGQRYYLPGEMCDPIGKNWFWVDGDKPRADDDLAKQFKAFRGANANFLLDVPPDKHGLIPDMHVQALARLRKNVGV